MSWISWLSAKLKSVEKITAHFFPLRKTKIFNKGPNKTSQWKDIWWSENKKLRRQNIRDWHDKSSIISLLPWPKANLLWNRFSLYREKTEKPWLEEKSYPYRVDDPVILLVQDCQGSTLYRHQHSWQFFSVHSPPTQGWLPTCRSHCSLHRLQIGASWPDSFRQVCWVNQRSLHSSIDPRDGSPHRQGTYYIDLGLEVLSEPSNDNHVGQQDNAAMGYIHLICPPFNAKLPHESWQYLLQG